MQSFFWDADVVWEDADTTWYKGMPIIIQAKYDIPFVHIQAKYDILLQKLIQAKYDILLQKFIQAKYDILAGDYLYHASLGLVEESDQFRVLDAWCDTDGTRRLMLIRI